MGAISTTDNILRNDLYERNAGFVFFLFCIWAFIVLCRPQDIFPVLGDFRPALVMAIATLIFVVIRYKDLPGPPLFNETQLKYYAVLLLIMILGIPASLYARHSFMTIFTGYISVVFFAFVFYKCVSSVKRLSTILLIGCLGNGLYLAFALAEYVPGTGRLSYGDMFDANDIAYVVLGFLPLNLIFISRDNPLWVRVACLGCLGMGVLLIFLSGSRAGLLSLGVAVTLLMLTRTKAVRFSSKALVIAASLIFISFSTIDTERYSTLLSLEDDYNIHSETGRLELWKMGLRALRDNPFTGVGVGNYSMAVGLDRAARGVETLRWQTAHNSVIQIGAETGIFGAALFLLMSLNVVRILNMAKKTTSQEKLLRIVEMGMIGFIGLFVSGLFLSQAYSFYWGFYVAVSAVVSQMMVRESLSRQETSA